ncbi:HAD hydrolase-like protein [bacterium]|nr:HAD hydrolase-like protein [bacterium]
MTKAKKKILVFDFDNVICDSTDECMVSSWNAWQKWKSKPGFRRTVSEFSAEEAAKFRHLRPRVRGAGEYYLLHRSFSENIEIKDQGDYNRLETSWDKHFTKYKVLFFEARNRLRKENLDAWIDLHHVFDDVIDTIRYYNHQNRFYIATLKDEESVRLILNKQGLLINGDRILDQGKITSKLQALDYIRDQLECQKDDLIFIDDNVTHLIEPQLSEYPVYLATWGSTVPEYLKIADQKKIPQLNQCGSLINLF